MSSASPTSGNRIIKTTELSAWFGIICLVCGLSTLSVSDSINKLLSSLGYHVVMIAWLRFTGNAVFMLFTMVPLYQRRTGRSILKTNNLRLQIARGCVLLLSSLIFFSMLRFMPIAEATALNFCAPLIVLAVSPWLLKEALSLPRWIAVIIGFVGMLIVVRPGGDIPPLGIILGICSAFSFSAFSLISKRLARDDDPTVTLFYGAIVGTVITSIAVPFFWSIHHPTTLEWVLILTIGIFGTFGHFLLNYAYKHADASMLMPFTYMQIIAAATLGWLLFDQFPDGLTLVGILIICSSGAGIAYYEYRMRQRFK
jgi:drug/metabolite transporter (DMT)-like permease